MLIKQTGGFGEVLECTHKGTKEKRAVKIVSKKIMTPKTQRWFNNEISILKKISHPHTVRLYEVFQNSQNYYLVQEMCTGGELFDEIIKRKRFNEKDTAAIMK